MNNQPSALDSESLARLPSIPLNVLELSVRARGCLERAGCETLSDVAARSDEELSKVRNLGRKTLTEIREKLCAYLERVGIGVEREMAGGPLEPVSMRDPELTNWLTHQDPRKISQSCWAHLIGDLQRANRGHERVAQIAAKIGAKWPDTRSAERLSSFLVPEIAELWCQAGLGKNKILTIIRCAIAVWDGWRDPAIHAFGERTDKLTSIAAELNAGKLASAMDVAFAITGITHRERNIFEKRYGLTGQSPCTLEQVGKSYGLTRERIRQIQANARKKLVRPPDLHLILKQALEHLEPQFFKTLTGSIPGFIEEQTQIALLECLGSWEGLLVELLYDDIDNWLSKRAERNVLGWVHGEATQANMSETVPMLTTYLRSCGVPVPVAVASRATRLPEPVVRLTALNGAGWMVGDFVTAQQLRAKEQRVLRVHVQTRAIRSPVLKRKALPELFHPGMPEDSLSPSTFSNEVGCFPQLLLRCGSEYVLRVTPPWEFECSDIQPAPPPYVFSACNQDEESDGDEKDDSSLFQFGFRLLQTRKLWRTGELADEFVRASQGRFSSTSVGGVTVGHPRVQRFAPGVWGVKDTTLTDADCRLLLTNEDCERYVEARRARADMTPFPMWNPEMELRWCRWANEHAPEDIFQSLLSVIAPDQWSCALPLREQWKQRQRANGRYRLARPPRKSLAQLPVVADELLAAVGAVVGRGGTSWMDLNILHGRTIDSHRSAPFLALLVALGAVESAKHWQEHHPSTPAALGIFRQLCKLWIQSPQGAGQPLLDFVRTAAELYLRKDQELSWASRAELQSLLSVLGKAEVMADEWEVPA